MEKDGRKEEGGRKEGVDRGKGGQIFGDVSKFNFE